MTPEQEQRVAALKRLGLKVEVLTCEKCGDDFVDPKPLGGLRWAVVTSTFDKRYGFRGKDARPFCSEVCATDGLMKAKGTAWVEGYEPVEGVTRVRGRR